MGVYMFKNLHTLSFFMLALILSSSGFAAQSGQDDLSTDQDKKCQDALSKAEDDLIRKVQNNAVLSPASQNQQQQQNPMAEAMQKMGEITNKRAELNQQVIEKKGQIEDQKYQQAMTIADKLHEYKTLEPKMRQEVTTIQLAKQKACMEIKNKCLDLADQQYAEMLATNQALAASTNFKTNSLQYARGTANRMIAQKKVFNNLCLAKPQTQAAFKMATEEVNAKLRNLKIEKEKNLSDISYIEGKIPLMNSHFDQKLNDIDNAAAIQEQALNQSQMMALVSAGMAMATASATADNGGTVAGTMLSARQTLDRFQAIKEQCMNATTKPIAVPDDVYAEIFLKVNKACRPDASPGQYCVISSRQNSAESMPANTKAN
jgi:hypothetical protein